MGQLRTVRNKGNLQKFPWKPLSEKQQELFTWWIKYPEKHMVIADGAIRSGKTVSMIASFVFWAMKSFNGYNFAICGKTIGSLKRNVIIELKKMLVGEFLVEELRDENLLLIAYKDKETNELIINHFYCFSGKDESSQDLVQGITLAGVLFDEVALMPESFVNQATARCSVEGSKMWFNCNPNSPLHWVKVELIDKVEEKKIHYIHFTMEDNLTLTSDVVDRYKSMYTGVFYDRYIKGLWVLAEGVIYDAFNNSMTYGELEVKIVKSWIGVDYGTSNATTFTLIGLGEDYKIYIMDEYYHSGRDGIKKSPEQYEKEFIKWEEQIRFKYKVKPEYVYIDPSANYFITQLWYSKEFNIPIRQADNKVIPGIQLVQSFISSDALRVNKQCSNVLKEFGTYRWDEKAQLRGEDKPIKENDHCLDSTRYVLYSNKIYMLKTLEQHNRIRLAI